MDDGNIQEIYATEAELAHLVKGLLAARIAQSARCQKLSASRLCKGSSVCTRQGTDVDFVHAATLSRAGNIVESGAMFERGCTVLDRR